MVETRAPDPVIPPHNLNQHSNPQSTIYNHSMLLTPLPAIPLIQPGDNLASIILTALERASLQLESGDILVLAQKIVSKSEGRLVNLSTVVPSPRAEELALQAEKDPRLVELILRESRAVLRVRPGTIIVEHRLGFVCASAGIDHSNVEGIRRTAAEAATNNDGEGVRSDGISRPRPAIGPTATEAATNNRNKAEDWMLLLPEDPDASAARIRQQFEAASGERIGVLIIDSHGRAWRLGVVGAAIGLSGLPGLVDMRGQPDLFGYHLRITLIGAADELAAAASLVMGQAAEGTPVIHVRGFPYPLREGSMKELLRPRDQDMFR
jgi:coenzyme F420-0:L-glutamate ligase/coenzyme F420-1:gamma-L-glutamate ligase